MRIRITFIVLLSSFLLFWACGDDTKSPKDQNQNIVVTEPAWHYKDYLIYADGRVTDLDHQWIGNYSFEEQVIRDLDGNIILEAVDLSTAPIIEPTLPSDSTHIEVPTDSTPTNPLDSVFPVLPPVDPSSSSSIPWSSSEVFPVDSNTHLSSSSDFEPEIQSSSSSEEIIPDPTKPLESYPVASYPDISSNPNKGWNTRYWDACKPHCSWIGNGDQGRADTTSEESYQATMTTVRNCNINDVEIPTFTLSKAVQQYWIGWEGVPSACEIGKKGAFTCTDMVPVAVNDTLAYAFGAGPAGTVCGKCYHMQYDGSFKDVGPSNAPKATHKALKGKHLILMSSNIGHDVKDGQFDVMVPGGGVGIYDALSIMVSRSDIDWGEQYGGFLTACQNSLGYDASLSSFQTCIRNKCTDAFTGFDNLLNGCMWFADWYMAADNPTYNWEEVECPQYLLDKYLTTINLTRHNDFKYQDDWSTYKGGELETQVCNETGCP